jgi:hypothetical protein
MNDESIVVALKLKNGQNILGYFLEDSQGDIDSGIASATLLYQPMCINLVSYSVNNSSIPVYDTELYFRYGSKVVAIPFDQIVTRSPASEFFAVFYVRQIGSLIAEENDRNLEYLKFFESVDIKNAMGETDSMLIKSDTEYVQ